MTRGPRIPQATPQTVVHVATGNPVAAEKQREWLRRALAQAPKQPEPKKAG